MDKKGLFITFEGIDGCGKTTQIKKFANYLFDLDKHNSIVLTREPYKDTDIRKILREDNDPFAKAEKLASMYIEDRRRHVNELILPNLNIGNIVVSDRYRFSTIAYQCAQGLDMNKLIEMQKDLPIPDITFIIDLPAEISAQRMKGEKGRSEHKFEANLEFQDNCRKNYLKLKDILVNENIVVINANAGIEEVFKDIKTSYENHIFNKTKKNNISIEDKLFY